MFKFPFVYVISSGSLTAGTSSAITQVFSSVKDFKLRYIRSTGNSDMTLSINEVSGNNFTSAALNTSLIGGVTNNGVPVMDDIIIPKGTQIKFTFTNGGASTVTEQLQLWGYEV